MSAVTVCTCWKLEQVARERAERSTRYLKVEIGESTRHTLRVPGRRMSEERSCCTSAVRYLAVECVRYSHSSASSLLFIRLYFNILFSNLTHQSSVCWRSFDMSGLHLG